MKITELAPLEGGTLFKMIKKKKKADRLLHTCNNCIKKHNFARENLTYCLTLIPWKISCSFL